MTQEITFTMPQLTVTIPEWVVWCIVGYAVLNLLLGAVEVRLRWMSLSLRMRDGE